MQPFVRHLEKLTDVKKTHLFKEEQTKHMHTIRFAAFRQNWIQLLILTHKLISQRLLRLYVNRFKNVSTIRVNEWKYKIASRLKTMAPRHRTIEFHVDKDDCDDGGGDDDKKKERPSEFIVHQDQIREKNEINERELV